MRNPFPLKFCPGIVRDYVSLMQNHTECPDEFLAATIMAVASALCGRWYTLSNHLLNNYYLILGPSALARKTTAIRQANKLIGAILNLRPDLTVEEPNEDKVQSFQAVRMFSSFSYEGLQRNLPNGGSAIALISEYGQVFDISQRGNQSNTISGLTELYDCIPIRHALTGQVFEISEFAFSLMAASTEEWVERLRTKENVYGGFLNRHLTFYGKTNRIIPFPTAPNEEAWLNIVSLLADVTPKLRNAPKNSCVMFQGTTTELEFNCEARDLWTEYYQLRAKELQELNNSLLANAISRFSSHCFKLMGLSAILSKRTKIYSEDLFFAILLNRWAEINVVRFLKSATGDPLSIKDPLCLKIISKLAKGPKSKRELMQHFGGGNPISKSLSHLVADELISPGEDGKLHLLESNQHENQFSDFFMKSRSYEFIQKSMLDCGLLDQEDDRGYQ